MLIKMVKAISSLAGNTVRNRAKAGTQMSPDLAYYQLHLVLIP